MPLMMEKIAGIWPEIILALGATICLFLGMWSSLQVRKATFWVAGISIALAALVTMFPGLLAFMMPVATTASASSADGGLLGYFAHNQPATPFAVYIKLAVCGVGLLLLLVAARVPDNILQARETDAGKTVFDPGNVFRGEFFAFFLLSLAGVMLCAGADELVWLFLALELTSLPTYVMVAISREDRRAHEAAVKYFFLGALAVAMFLYGFALIYGATGTTVLYSAEGYSIAQYISEYAINNPGEPLPPLLIVGMVLAVVGISFKIAAVPMHYYVADVYQGASTAVTAFLAFVPKTAGFVSLMLLLGVFGWPLPTPLIWLLFAMAVATMTLGNIMGLMQSSVKRALAYSSVAHSGYMLIGLTAGAASTGPGSSPLESGLAGVLFYLVAYGVGNLGAFAVLGAIERNGEEADTYEDIEGLVRKSRQLAAIMLVSLISLIGLPPLVGFLGKIYLFGPAFAANEPLVRTLVIFGAVNSAIGAVYYLRIASACFFSPPTEGVTIKPAPTLMTGAIISAVVSIILGIGGGVLVDWADHAARPIGNVQASQEVASAPAPPDVLVQSR